MPSKTPHRNGNGNKPVGNGVNGTRDVEMKDDAPAKKGGKGKKVKETEEEMTVVVPPSKGTSYQLLLPRTPMAI